MTTPSKEALREALPMYALGDVTAEEVMAIERALADDPEGREELRALTETVHQLAQIVPTAAPPPNGFDRLWKHIEEEAESGASAAPRHLPLPAAGPRPRRGSSRMLPVALAAAAAGALILGALLARELRAESTLQTALDGALSQMGQGTRERAELARQLEDLRGQLRESRRDELVRALQAPDLRVSLLGPRDAAAAGIVRLLWRPSEAVWIVVGSGLGPPLTDRDLQLWGLRGGAPTSAGILPVSPDGTVHHRVPLGGSLAGSDTAAITLEPKGGSPQPTGPMLFAGTI
jgi:anti-sigma-K factor RskA